MNGQLYQLNIGHVQPAIELVPNVGGLIAKHGLKWGTAAFIQSVEKNEIQLVRYQPKF